jgi:nucleoside-diphosphate-sugar epimerase
MASRSKPLSVSLVGLRATRVSNDEPYVGMKETFLISRFEGDHGFVPQLIRVARETGVAAHVGDGTNRWPAVHRLDAARAFRLALEKAPAGGRVHAIAEEGIPAKEIAAAIGRRLGVPVTAKPVEHFGWIGPFFALDAPTSSERTRRLLGWRPVEKGLLADLDSAAYFGP